MPDVTLIVKDLGDAAEAENLERALGRLGPVNEANADPDKGIVAVSYEGGEKELEEIGHTIEDAGHKFQSSPGAEKAGG